MDKLKTIQQLLELVDTKKNADEMVKAFETILKVAVQIKQANETERQEIKGEVDDAIQRLTDTIQKRLSEIHEGVDGHTPTKEELLALITPLIPAPQPGEDGKDADEEAIIKSVLALIPKNEDYTAADLRDKFETLEGDERLDAKFIKNLPTIQTTEDNAPRKLFGGNRALSRLNDVDVKGIAVGQSIKWDGVRWIPYTPAGGAATSVYNEVVSGNTTTFTLAHTPTSGTLRVYARGQRQIPTTNYSLSGAIITTIDTWATGDITADYNY